MKIETCKTEISRHYQSMLENWGYVTAETLKNALQGIGTKQNSVMREFSDMVEEKSKSVGIIITEGTLVKYRLAYRHFSNFLKEKYNAVDMGFENINIELIEAFARYLKIDLKMLPNTVRIYMKHLRTLVKRTFHRGLLRQDPFFDYKPEKISNKRRWISHDELERIMKAEMKFPTHQFTKDMFVFACFTGISYADLYHLKHSDIQMQEDGSRIIILKRQKTGVSSCIPLLSAAQAILDRHRDSQFTGWGGKVFRLQTLTMMEKHLKEIAKAAKVDKCLTFHMGRHTFATTVCLSQGVPIETLSRMLGHSSIYTTQIYAEVTRTKINEDMTNLEKRIVGKYKLAETGGNKLN